MDVLPFGEFLEVLRARGLGVSLHEHLAVGKLLARWDSTSREEFRNALASLIARNEAEVASIRRLFDQQYPAEADKTQTPTLPPPRAADRRVQLIQLMRSARVWTIATALVTVVFAAVLLVWYYTDTRLPRLPEAPRLVAALAAPPQPFEPAIKSVPDALVQVVGGPPPVDLPVPPSRVNWALLGGFIVALLTVSMVVSWGRHLRSRARQWTTDAWQGALASIPGPYHGRLVLKDLVYRLPRQDLDEAATLLARSFSRTGVGRELDVSRSLKETIRSGMRPHLIFRSRRVQETILLVQDVSQSTGVYSRRVESFISDLSRQGIAVEPWYFDGDVSVVSQRRDGPPVPLEMLARRRQDWPLMVVSAGIGVTATLAKPDQSWRAACRSWSRRVWMTPILDPQMWPAALRELPLTALPMTRAGLLQAATILSQGEHAAAGALNRVRVATTPVTLAHVERLEQLSSLVPNPTLDQLELLRQRFAPDIPETAVLHVATGAAVYAGTPIEMADGDIRDHLRRLREETPQLEAQARRYLLKVLKDSEPAAGSAARLRWEMAVAIHQLQLSEITSEDPSAALAALEALANGPLWHELRSAVQRLPSSGRSVANVRKVAGVQRETDDPPAFRAAAGQMVAIPFRWTAHRWQELAVATAVALIAASAASLTGAFRVQASHAMDAYALEYRPSQTTARDGELHVTIRSETAAQPRRVQLYRDALPFGPMVDVVGDTGAIVPIDASGAAHVYQARAGLPGGAFALSNTLLAPSVLIVVDAQPWARVTIRSQNAQIPVLTQTTPVALRLPEGEYDLAFENGGLTGQALTERIQVTSVGQRVFRYNMPAFNPAQIARDLDVADMIRQTAGSRPTAAKK